VERRASSLAIIPPALSPKISESSGHGTSPKLISIGAMEDDASVRARIGAYWAAVPGAYADVIATENQLWSTSNGRAGWVEYWSAAFISYVMCRAGLSNAQFLRAESHRDYIQAAIDARESADNTYLYHAYDIGEMLPSPGDIIVPREKRLPTPSTPSPTSRETRTAPITATSSSAMMRTLRRSRPAISTRSAVTFWTL
jgi:hypothetical protein